jgi:predicted AlkP superfamily pyrophosphatase or phosphodiesterase
VKPFLRILLGIALVTAAGCANEPSVSQPRAPMILFAVDGLEWNVMAPLLEAGDMPVTAGLMQRGSFGYLQSMEPTYSAVIWTSIATGKTPEKHGIRHFVYPTEDGEYRYYTSGHRATKAFWNILSDYDLRVHCLGWWITYPAEAINGTMVSQTNTTGVLHNPRNALWKGTLLKGVEDQVYPAAYQNEVMSLLEESDASIDDLTRDIFGTQPNEPDEWARQMWDEMVWSLRADVVYMRVARDILAREPDFDLMAVYIGGPDVTAHRFWHYAYPDQFEYDPPTKQIENYKDVIDDYYRYVDREMGRIVDTAPEGTTVLIVSDHGMHSMPEFDRIEHPKVTTSGHHLDAPDGVLIAAGQGIRRSGIDPSKTDVRDGLQRVGGVLDVLPTILAFKGIPLGEDLDGRPILKVVNGDWLSTAHIDYVPTHDTEEWMAGRADRMRQAIDESERLEQLRSLGYIR